MGSPSPVDYEKDDDAPDLEAEEAQAIAKEEIADEVNAETEANQAEEEVG